MSEYRLHPRAALLLVVLLLLLSSIFASDQLVPQRIRAADFYIYDAYLVGTTFGAVSDLTLNVSIPSDGVLTQVPPGASRQTDADGNSVLSIRQADPLLPYNFTYNLSVHTGFQPLTSLPAAGPIPPGLGRYLISTPAMPASDPAIKGLAANITAGAGSDFGRIALLAQWVHGYITYDSSAAGTSPNVTSILSARRGVCTEYSMLFVTLARSLGYPARFVNGYAYASGLGVWQAHSWAEVWLGEWVPVDPTWLEAGSVDATHIVVSRSALSDFNLVSVSGMVQEPGRFILNGDRPLGSIADNVHLISSDSAPAESGYGLYSSSSTLPGGGRALVWVSYAASDYRILSIELAPCSSNGGSLVTLLSPARQSLVTAPNQTYYAFWLVQAAPQIDPNFIYRCPLTLNSEYLGLKTSTISLRDDLGSPWPILSADVERAAVPLGGKQTVFVHLPAAMAGTTVHLLEPTLYLNASVNWAGAARFEFTPSGPGNHTFYVFSSSGDPLALSYSVITSPAPEISSAAANQSLVEGEPAGLIVNLTGLDTGAAARPFALAWSGDGESGRENVGAGPSEVLRIPIRPSMAGDFVFSWRLIAADGTEIASLTSPLTVWPAGDVSFVSLQPQSRTNSGWQAALQFAVSGEIRHPQLLVGGTTWDIPPDGRLVVILASERQPASVSWQDATGAIQRRDIVLEISSAAATPVFQQESAGNPPLAGLYDPKQNVLLPALLVFLFFGAIFGGAFYSHIRELHELSRSDAEVGKGKDWPGPEAGRQAGRPGPDAGRPGSDDAVAAKKSDETGAVTLPDMPKPDLGRRRQRPHI